LTNNRVLKQNDITILLSSPLNPVATEMSNRIAIKGDAVKDVAFAVSDAKALYDKAVSRGAVSVLPPTELKDEHGTVIIATVRTYGDSDHSFVQRNDYKGLFMPGMSVNHHS
jgi:4-hydroxyphenylpyruvate dioxygenase